VAEPGIVDAGRLQRDHAVMLTTPCRAARPRVRTTRRDGTDVASVIDTLRQEFSDLPDAAQWVRLVLRLGLAVLLGR
jgi:hypothetical protein